MKPIGLNTRLTEVLSFSLKLLEPPRFSVFRLFGKALATVSIRCGRIGVYHSRGFDETRMKAKRAGGKFFIAKYNE
jgi:hypothetical protein